MALRNAKALTYSPSSVCDSLDGTEAIKGAMSALGNLVPDPTTTNLFIPRPASEELTNFSGFSTPGFISAILLVGDVLYGMIASAAHTGHDEPFAYNILTNTFTSISGTSSGNTPTSQSPNGAWTPPTMALISTKIIVTSNGFSGSGSNYFGVLDISTPATPAWSSENTATTALPSVPTGVFNFNNRAYYICKNALYYSDVLVPDTITNASQFLVLGDTTPIVVLGGLPLLSTTVGGVVQSMIAFKANTAYQITGDSALSNLTLSSINAGVGTSAPLSVVGTPIGLAFIAGDGLRIVNEDGSVSGVIGEAGSGIALPFINALLPSRIAAAYNFDTIRISVGSVEYWYHITRKIWTGPHTFPASLITAYDSTFIMAPLGITNSLWQSDPIPNINSSYTENGNSLMFNYQSTLLPDTKEMAENCVVETTLAVAFQGNAGQINFSMLDENQSVIDQVYITPPPGEPTIWGAFNWGGALWYGQLFNLKQVQIPWDQPIIFKQAFISAVGSNVTGLKIGNFYMRYQILGYLIQ